MRSLCLCSLSAVAFTVAPPFTAAQSPPPSHVRVHTHTLGWPTGWLVARDSARLGLVLDGHADTAWISNAEVAEVETTAAPTLAAAPEGEVGGVRGPRVRFKTAEGAWRVGVLAAQDSARLGLVFEAAAETTWLARSEASNLEVSVGQRHPTGTAVGLGALGGALIGGAVAAASYTPCTGQGLSCIGDFGQGLQTLGGAIVGAGAGALVGLIVGSSTTEDQWQPVQDAPVRIGIAPSRHGVGIGLAIRIR